MSHHNHGQGHGHDKKGHAKHGTKKRPLHRDWRLWVAVVLMLFSMFIYIITMDESMVPGGPPPERPPVVAPVE